MNQDGSSAMPQNPSFSTPNSTEPTPAPIEPATPAPAPQAPATPVSAPVMSSNPAPAPIASSPEQPQKSHIFGNRKARLESKRRSDAAVQTASTSSLMSNSPDFFKQAAGIDDTVVMLDGADKPKRKGLGIVIAIVLVLAAVGIAALIAVPNIISSVQEGQQNDELKSKFYALARYITYGKDDEVELPARRPKLVYTALTEGGTADYIKKAQDKLSDFTKLVSGIKNDDKTAEIKKNLDYISDSYAFLSSARLIEDLKPGIIVNQATGESDEEKVRTLASGYTSLDDMSDYERNAVTQYLLMRIKLSQVYSDNNCILVSQEYDNKCSMGGSIENDINKAYPEAKVNFYRVKSSHSANIMDSLWAIKGIMDER